MHSALGLSYFPEATNDARIKLKKATRLSYSEDVNICSNVAVD